KENTSGHNKGIKIILQKSRFFNLYTSYFQTPFTNAYAIISFMLLLTLHNCTFE
ncbi:7997_t:CDS:1, partial [Gigaspora rosea]